MRALAMVWDYSSVKGIIWNVTTAIILIIVVFNVTRNID